MSFPRYPKYKPSGVEWFGAVPEHWENTSGRRVFAQVREPSRPEDDQLSATQKYGVIPQQRFMELEDQKVALALNGVAGFQHVEPNDFVISLRSFQGGIERSQHRGCVSPAYTVLRARIPTWPPYWALLLKSAGYVSALQSRTDGIRDGKAIGYGQFAGVCVPMPPLPEQRAIAAFLERETAKIDALVAEQERLIELLAEKRQAVISHAVTKGLDPTAPMKPSGIEWLGDVPAHWALSSIKRETASIEQGWSPQCEGASVETPEDWGVLKVGCVNGGRFNPDENKKLPADLDPVPSLGIRVGDLLISRANTRDLVGSVAVAETDYPRLLLCDKLYRLRFREATSSNYAALYLQTAAARSQIEVSATGASSSMLNIPQSAILDLPFPCPVRQEQDQIVHFLEEVQSRIRQLIETTGSALLLLKERRSALISAAVTGQIDVRNAVPAEVA